MHADALTFASGATMPRTDLETTQDLVGRVRQGDAVARDLLMRRYLPILRRWAHGRLPPAARDLNDTADMVQVALMRAFQHLPAFEARGPGAFFGYLRHVMTNLLRDEARRAVRRPLHGELPEDLGQSGTSPLREVITVETLQAYEAALQTLGEEEREMVVMRVELGLSHEEIAELSGSPSANAARMRVARALARLAQAMAAHRQ